jgi:hypothetical protein
MGSSGSHILRHCSHTARKVRLQGPCHLLLVTLKGTGGRRCLLQKRNLGTRLLLLQVRLDGSHLPNTSLEGPLKGC